MKKAYLYSRVSKEKQAKFGKGLQRQVELAKDFLAQHPDYQIADVFEDAGTSAFYPKNLQKDAGLGAFLQIVREGKIEPNSMLIIEAVDRLSRLGIREGQKIFDELRDNKINVAIVKFNLVIWWWEDNDLANSIQISAGLYLGRLESEQKSKRILKTFEFYLNEVRKGTRLFKRGIKPAWLELNETKTGYVCSDYNKDVIQQIFKLKLHDKLGVRRIVHWLNREGIKPFSGRKEWTYTAVSNLLKNKAVSGIYQPITRAREEHARNDSEMLKLVKAGVRIDIPNGEPIQNYFPIIIDEDSFNATQATFQKRVSTERLKGRKGGFKNLFRHITFCKKCGSVYNVKAHYLCCMNPVQQCNNSYIIYSKVEEKLLHYFQSKEFFDDIQNIEEKPSEANDYKRKAKELKQIQNNLEIALETAKDIGVITRLVGRVNDIAEEIEDLNRLIAEETNRVNQVRIFNVDKNFDLDDEVNREKFNLILRNEVEYIQFYKKFIFIRIKNTNYEVVTHEYLPDFWIKKYDNESTNKLERSPARKTTTEKIEKNNNTDKFLEKYRRTIEIRIVKYIFQRQIDEDLTRKQTTRLLRKENLSLSAEEIDDIRKLMNVK